jgi:hypothetical protein
MWETAENPQGYYVSYNAVSRMLSYGSPGGSNTTENERTYQDYLNKMAEYDNLSKPQIITEIPNALAPNDVALNLNNAIATMTFSSDEQRAAITQNFSAGFNNSVTAAVNAAAGVDTAGNIIQTNPKIAGISSNILPIALIGGALLLLK